MLAINTLAIQSPSSMVATTGLMVITCCGFSIALTTIMKRHIRGIRLRKDAFQDWRTVTELRSNSLFVNTIMLLAAPVAWRIWYVMQCNNILIALTTGQGVHNLSCPHPQLLLAQPTVCCISSCVGHEHDF